MNAFEQRSNDGKFIIEVCCLLGKL